MNLLKNQPKTNISENHKNSIPWRNFFHNMSCFCQEWDEKAKEAKQEFNAAMEEYLKNKPEGDSDEEEEDDK